jgi:hypothetical protein
MNVKREYEFLADALSIVDVWTAPHTLVHTLGSQLRGLKDGQYLLWEVSGLVMRAVRAERVPGRSQRRY